MVLGVLSGLVFCPAAPVFASAVDCGTIVIPPGVGIGPGADLTSFNPELISSAYNAEAVDMLFEQFIWINRYHQIDWTRSIASAVTSPDNGKTYDITLRPWRWSDGVKVTSADVIYALKVIKGFGSNYVYDGQGDMPDIIQSMTASDPMHLRIVLKRQVNPNWFILNGLVQLMPLPEHAWRKYTTDEIWRGQSDPAFFRVVDGPLLLKNLVVGVDAEFVPNPYYGGEKMHFDRLIMKFENSEGQELQAVESGDLDMSNIPFDLFDKAEHLPGMYVETMPATYTWHELVPNMLNPATRYFADVRVRDALADAINQKEMIGLAMHGYGVPEHGPVPPQPSAFLSPSARLGNYPVGYDPAKAKALLAAAGFTPGPDGILQRQGQKFVFTLDIPAGQALRIEMAETMQQDLRAVGIEMKVRQVELNEILTEMVSEPNKWEAILIASDMTYYPTAEGMFVTGAFYNNNGYSSPTMNRLVKQSTDEPGMQGLFDYQDYASAQQPVVFLPTEQYSVLVRNGLHGLQDFANPLGLWAPEKLYCTAP